MTARSKVIKGERLNWQRRMLFTARPVLRKWYLRDDIPCGIEGCNLYARHPQMTMFTCVGLAIILMAIISNPTQMSSLHR